MMINGYFNIKHADFSGNSWPALLSSKEWYKLCNNVCTIKYQIEFSRRKTFIKEILFNQIYLRWSKCSFKISNVISELGWKGWGTSEPLFYCPWFISEQKMGKFVFVYILAGGHGGTDTTLYKGDREKITEILTRIVTESHDQVGSLGWIIFPKSVPKNTANCLSYSLIWG